MDPAESLDGRRPQKLSDDELINEWKRRTGAARGAVVDELFERHYERVARWCYRFTNDREAAADLAQDVFLKAHRHLGAFKGTSTFSTWLYSIVRNESLNRLKRLRTDVDGEEVLADVAALEARPDALAETRNLAARLKAFLTANLDRTEQAVFTLHYGDDMTLDAITRLLRLDNASGAKAYIVSALWQGTSVTTRVSLPEPVVARFEPGKTILWEVTARNAAGQVLAVSGTGRFRVALGP